MVRRVPESGRPARIVRHARRGENNQGEWGSLRRVARARYRQQASGDGGGLGADVAVRVKGRFNESGILVAKRIRSERRGR
jgi:hypothetical protein